MLIFITRDKNKKGIKSFSNNYQDLINFDQNYLLTVNMATHVLSNK